MLSYSERLNMIQEGKKIASDEDFYRSITRSINRYFELKKGNLLTQPDLGCDVTKWFDAAQKDTNLKLLLNELTEHLTSFEPRIETSVFSRNVVLAPGIILSLQALIYCKNNLSYRYIVNFLSDNTFSVEQV